MEEGNPWLEMVEDSGIETVPSAEEESIPRSVKNSGWMENIGDTTEVPEEIEQEPDEEEQIRLDLDDETFDAIGKASEQLGVSQTQVVGSAIRRYLREGGWL